MKKRDPFLTAFGSAVRLQRKSKKLTQETLAEKSGLDTTYISRIECGAANASLIMVSFVAKALGLTTSELFKMAEDFLALQNKKGAA